MKNAKNQVELGRSEKSFERLPRPRPPAPQLESKNGMQALADLRRLRPGIDLKPGTESAFRINGGLTQSGCLLWLEIATKFYAEKPTTVSDPVSLLYLPPISFLNLLTEWIDWYARLNKRKRTKSANWRWRALQGFVHNSRQLKTKRFLTSVVRLAKSVGEHFSKPPFDTPFLTAWGDWLYFNLESRPRIRVDADRKEHGRKYDHLFKVLGGFAKTRKVCKDDAMLLAQFVSINFRQAFNKSLPDKKIGQSPSDFIAYAAAMDLYLQHLDNIKFSRYVNDVTRWAVRLGEPGMKSQFEAIQARFCGFRL